MLLRYIIIFLLLVGLELVYFRLADRFNIIDKPNERSSHSRVTLRGGGIIFLIGMWLHAIFFGFEYVWFLMGLTVIALISFVDDLRSISNKLRLFVHFAAMLLMFYQLGLFANGYWWYLLPALILSVGIINAYNFMDGINGITGSYSLSVILPMVVVNMYVHFIDMTLLNVALMSVLVFCFFNFRSKAKCFAGDAGAVGIAFIIVFALGLLILTTRQFWYLIFLAVYGVDSIMTILHRFRLRENILEPHRKHAYQLMVNELHIPHVIVSGAYFVLQLVISLGAIWLPINKWLYFIVVVVILVAVYMIFKRKYYHLHEEYLLSIKQNSTVC